MPELQATYFPQSHSLPPALRSIWLNLAHLHSGLILSRQPSSLPWMATWLFSGALQSVMPVWVRLPGGGPE